MLQFMGGFLAGIWVGTHYDCKPLLTLMAELAKDYMPKKK